MLLGRVGHVWHGHHVDGTDESVAERYRRLSAHMTELVAAVPARAWANPSPCEGWTALDLAEHLVDVHRIFQSLVGRELVAHPPVREDPLGAWCAVRDQMQADLEDPDRVAEEYDGRLGRSTFGAAVDGFVCFDLVAHGWDLARATGQDDRIDPQDVARVQAAVDAMGEVMRANGVIAEPVEPAPDASPQDRLIAALGRRP
jgi:uncharacterized protein (TIGR03086 family)